MVNKIRLLPLVIFKVHNFSSRDTEIPAFTICPQYEKGYKNDLLQAKYNRSVTDIRKFNFPDNVENSREFFYEVTYNISEFVKSIYIRFKDVSSEVKSRRLILTFSQNGIDASNGVSYKYSDFLTHLNWISFGQCHTFEIRPDMKKLTVMLPNIFNCLDPLLSFCRWKNWKL